MRSSIPKVLHALGGRTLMDRVLDVAEALEPAAVTVVVGHMADRVGSLVRARGHQVALQAHQLGTAHALQQAEGVLGGAAGTLVLLSGDVPLLERHTLGVLLQHHGASGAAATILTAELEVPAAYGRILRTPAGSIERIVEARDASPAQLEVREINAGIYAFEVPRLWDGLRAIADGNSQGEFYLTDLVDVFHRQGLKVETVRADDARSVLGINTREELAEAAAVLRGRKNEALMASGVTVLDPATTFVDSDVEIGQDTVIHPGVTIERGCRIGRHCEIRSHVRLTNAILGDGVTINDCCVVIDSTIADGATVGPFAHLRPGTVVGKSGKVGNFVELKKTTLGEGSKVNHLSYLGDATLGQQVNVGAGTITCNYDGASKHATVIGDGAFIGSGTELVAPVDVGAGAYVGAGSTITEDVPPAALGVARARQRNVEGWAGRARKKRG